MAVKKGAKYISIDATDTPTKVTAVSLASLKNPFAKTPSIILYNRPFLEIFNPFIPFLNNK